MTVAKLVDLCTYGDCRLVYLLNGKLKCRFLDRLMPLFSQLGGALFSVGICLALIVFGHKELQTTGYMSLAALTGSHLIVQVLKRVSSRTRPYLALPNVNTVANPLRDYSFPSGHSTAAYALAMTFSLNHPSLSALFVLAATGVGLSRIYLGLHYPSDVFIGAVIGVTSSLLVFYF